MPWSRYRIDQGNLTSSQMRDLAKIAREAGDGCLRVTVEQNLVLGFVQLGFLPRVHAALKAIGLGNAGRAGTAGCGDLPGRVFLQPGSDKIDEPGLCDARSGAGL